MRGGGIDGDGSTERGEESEDAAPDLDEFHRLLCSASRRRILYYLQEHPESPLEELSDVLAGWRAVEEDAVVGPHERNRIGLALHHADVPRLAESEVLAYDHENREVSLDPLPEQLSRILQATREYERESGTSDSDGVRPGP